MENTYWNGNGRYQADYDRLAELMPAMGRCDTVAGELIRAASRLGHDFYNNGMGNNTSGAVNFLRHKGAVERSIYRVIYPYTRGQLYDGHYQGDLFQIAMEKMVDQTVEFIRANPHLETQPNSEDMFDYSEEDQHWCEDCGDEIDGRGFISSVCRDCEEAYCEEEDDQ
jgi:hypothetical protein